MYYLFVLIGALIGASSSLYIKFLPFSVESLTLFRMGVPALILFFWSLSLRQVHWRDLSEWKLLLASILNMLRMYLYVLAFKWGQVGTAVILLYTWPFFSMLYNRIFLKERLSPQRLLLLIVAFLGLLLTQWGDRVQSGSPWFAMLAMLVSAALFAGSANLFKSVLKNKAVSLTVFYQNAPGALFFLILAFFINDPVEASVADYALASFYGLSVGVLAFGLFFTALKKISIFNYGVLSYAEVLYASVFSIVIFNEQWHSMKWIGAAVLVGSGLLVLHLDRKKKKR